VHASLPARRRNIFWLAGYAELITHSAQAGCLVERRAAEAAGWEIAYDGMEVRL
jgi:hypothetical protein